MPLYDASILVHLCAAWLAGSMIGLEREYHGHPAGFRTHALVSLASALLMVAMEYQWLWLGSIPAENVRTDPTRMAQAIMMGIGFLGAGVIFKDGFSIQGLTTAASIWVTAVIGILFGIGFWMPAVIGTAIVVVTLSVFQSLESRLPGKIVVLQTLQFMSEHPIDTAEIKEILTKAGFRIEAISYALIDKGRIMEYSLKTTTKYRANVEHLARVLKSHRQITEFRLAPRDN